MDSETSPKEETMTDVESHKGAVDSDVFNVDVLNGNLHADQDSTAKLVYATPIVNRDDNIHRPILPGLIHLHSDGLTSQDAPTKSSMGSSSNLDIDDVLTSDTIAFQIAPNANKNVTLPNDADSDYESTGEPGIEFDSDPYESNGDEPVVEDDDSTEIEDQEDEVENEETEGVEMVTNQSAVELATILINEENQRAKPKKSKPQEGHDNLDPEDEFYGLHYKPEIPNIVLDPQTPLLKLGIVVGIIPPERPKAQRKFVPTKSLDTEIPDDNESPGEIVMVTIHNSDDHVATSGRTALDAGTVVFVEDRRVVGVIADTIGPVKDPFYLVAFKNWDLIEEFDIKLGAPIYFDEKHNRTVEIAGLTRRRTGKDEVEEAENGIMFYDDPADDDDFEDSEIASTPPFSDDEKEVRYKEQRDAKRQRRSKKRVPRGQRREGGYGANMHFPTGKRRADELAEEGEVEEGYTRLQRPGSFSHTFASSHGGRGDRGGRGGRGSRGDRHSQQGRFGNQYPNRPQYSSDVQRFHSAQPQSIGVQSNSPSMHSYTVSPAFQPGVVPPVSFPGVPADAQRVVDQMLENLVKERVQDQVNAVLKSLGVAPGGVQPAMPSFPSPSAPFSAFPGLSAASTPMLGAAGNQQYIGHQQYGQQHPQQQPSYNLGAQPPLYQQPNSMEQQNAQNPRPDVQQNFPGGHRSYNQNDSRNHPYGRR